MPEYKRNTAYKLRIGDLFKGKNVFYEDRLSFVELGDKKIIRVNIVANIIDKFLSEGEKKYLSFTIDDASGQIRIKIFGESVNKFSDLNQGDSIMVIGNLRSFNNELYILPEIIKVKDPRYLFVRKLELEAGTEKTKQTTRREEEKNEVKAVRDQIIDMMKNAEKEGGLETEKLIMQINAEPELINQEIRKLLEEGIAFEPRPGRLRFLG